MRLSNCSVISVLAIAIAAMSTPGLMSNVATAQPTPQQPPRQQPARQQPAALLLWGRHDSFFDLAEVESWLRDLPRMEAHVLDAGHLLLETHSRTVAPWLVDFIARSLR